VRAAAAAAVGAMSAELAAGADVAGYRVEALVGRGGMGVVYRAHDLALERPVALKVLSPELADDDAFRGRFLRESRLAASLDHPSVVPVYDAGEARGDLYIAMRYVEGTDLKELLAAGPLDPERALALLAPVASALDAAHARGLVHRDVKPSNVLVSAEGHVYLADFGLTRRLGEAGTSLGVQRSLGTVAYVAPEQIRGEDVDGRADVYSLACVLHECLTGSPPFVGSDAAVLFAHLEQEPPAAAGVEAVLRAALAKTPEERFATCGELVDEARNALGLGVLRRDRRVLGLAALGAALIAAGLLGYFLTRGVGAPATTGSVLRIDAATGRVERRFAVGNEPGAIAVGSGRVWAANFADGTVSKIDVAAGTVQPITVNGSPLSLAVHRGVVFVVDGPPANSLTLINAESGNAYEIVDLPNTPTGGIAFVAAGPAGVWLADEQGSTVSRVEATAGAPTRFGATARFRLSPAADLNGLAVARDGIWLTGNALDPRLWRFDPRSARIVAATRLPVAPKGVAAGAGSVWVTGEIEDVLLRIDPRTSRIVDRIPTGRGPAGVAVGGGSVWVADSLDGTVLRVDARTGRILRTIRVGGSPSAVAVAGGSVWVAGSRS
jgi:DNA-binding beta-propeller fold protein YncE